MAPARRSARQRIRLFPPNVRRLGGLLACGCVLAAFASEVGAVDWEIEPGVSIAENYSDNIRLAPPGQEEDDFVTEVIPQLSMRGESRRFFLNLFADLQFLHYARNSEADTMNPQLRAVGNAELVEELFFVDLTSTYRQENTDSFGRLASDTVSLTNNQNDLFTLLVSPFLRHRFGTFMDGELRYTYDKVDRIDVKDDSEGNAGRVEFVSGSQFELVPWLAYYDYSNEESDSSGSSTFERGEFRGTYFVNRKIGIQLGTGYERVEFDLPPTDEDTVTWRAGLTLRPSPRTLLEGGMEHRVFGDAPFVTFSHTSRRTSIILNYREDITTTNRIRLDQNFIPVVDSFGNPVLDVDTGEAITIAVDEPTQVNEVVVTKRLDGTLAVEGVRTNVSLSAFGTRREFEVSPDENIYGVELNANRRLSSSLTARAWGAFSHWQFEDSDSDRDRWQVGLGVEKQFARDLFGHIDARHVTQTSDNPADEYDENRISVQLEKVF